MKGLKVFIQITAVSLIILIIAFIVFYLSWVGNESNPLSKPDKIQALTSILALFIGTAAALGSAIAALKVATLGLEISHQQERRDNITFVDSKIEKSIDVFSEVALTLGDIHSSAIAVNAMIPIIPKEQTKMMMEQPLDEALSLRVIQLSDNLFTLAHLLKQVMKNDLAKNCFSNALKTFHPISDSINQTLKSIDPNVSNHSVYTLSLNNLSDIASILDLAQRRLKLGNLGDLIQARLFTNSSDIPMFNLPYDNANVRNFFFLGNLILSITSKDNNPFFIANYGASILHDIFFAIPTGKIIEAVLQERYSNLFTGNQTYKVDFDPKEIASFYFQDALKQADSIGNLYLMVGKTEKP